MGNSRELLITTKVAQNWQEDFDRNVDVLLKLINTIDNDNTIDNSSEVLNIYRHSTAEKAVRKKRLRQSFYEKPFSFTVFKN